MDLIIKNLERLKDYSDGNHRPIERVVVDFDKLATEDFAQLFFDACEKYDEVDEKYDEVDESYLQGVCRTCKYDSLNAFEEPCYSCIESFDEISPNWERKEPEEDCKYSIINDSGKKECSKFGTLCLSVSCTSKEPTLKEVTERMQSEFDATGKDVKAFMNRRIIKK